jgi:putative endonuclease
MTVLLRKQEPRAENHNEGRICLHHGKRSQRNALRGRHQRLAARTYQHRNGLVEGFTKEYGCTLLVWFEDHDDLQEARLRELQIRKWKRAWKIELIEQGNPHWKDLFEALF